MSINSYAAAADLGANPSHRLVETYSTREIFVNNDRFEQSAEVFDIHPDLGFDGSNTGKEYELRPGIVLGKITSGTYAGKACPLLRSRITTAAGSGTTFTCRKPYGFKVGYTIKVGATTTTITAITHSTGSVTVAASVTWTSTTDMIGAGDYAGAENAVAIMDEFRTMWNELKTARKQVSVRGVISCNVQNAMMLNDLMAAKDDAIAGKLITDVFVYESGKRIA
jgi:hypothetical protein